MSNVVMCSRCVLDTTVPEILFDEQGICQYCKIYDELNKKFPLASAESTLNDFVHKIRKKGEGKKYDCIVGVSGGTDSTYTLYLAVQLGLRPLAVHFDNGWNSVIAVKNIKRACDKLKVDLYTYVVDWEEFKDIQVSFLRASTSDAETPTDIGILSTLFRVARREGLKYILYGHSFRTEGVAPVGWTYYDGKYIKSVHRQFGKVKMKTYPNFTLKDFIVYYFWKRIKMVPVLNYVNYSKSAARELMERELDWQDSGGHHHESIYTHFFHSFLLPTKFGIDKRKVELSAKILSKQTTRSEAIEFLKKGAYPYQQELVNYAIEKLELTTAEFDSILKEKPKSFADYPSYLSWMRLLKTPFKWAHELNLIPELIFLKYKNIL